MKIAMALREDQKTSRNLTLCKINNFWPKRLLCSISADFMWYTETYLSYLSLGIFMSKCVENTQHMLHKRSLVHK